MITDYPIVVAKQFRDLMNEQRVAEVNHLVSDDFFAVFVLGDESEVETYHAEQYRRGNEQAFAHYDGKKPHWHYTDLKCGRRSDTEFVITSFIDFTLADEPVMRALVMEVYRYEADGQWRLLRQYMEKFR